MTTRSELLEVLETYLRDDLQQELGGMLGFQNRIAANLIGMLRREEQLRPVLSSLDRRFAQEHGLDADAMPRALSRALRDGDVIRSDELDAYLRLRALLAMAIDNPRYSGFAQARERWAEASQLKDI